MVNFSRTRSIGWSRNRQALAVWPILGTLCVTATLAGAGYWAVKSLTGGAASADFIAQQVVTGPFVHDVVQRGELESSANVPVRCEVQSRTAGSMGIKILEIVPEGTNVEAGDFLVKFDDAALQSERLTQEIAVGAAEALSAQSQNDYDSALIARQEYEFGEFENEKEKINGEILVAKESTDRAIDNVEFYARQVRRGYWSPSKLRSAEFDAAKAKSDLRIAQTKMKSLDEFTKPKKISELDSKVKTCAAKLKEAEAKLALERTKLEVIEKQITLCVLKAPVAGQVIYDHERDQWGGGQEQKIKQGTIISEQRCVIRLPDPKQMQVVTKVEESRIDLVKVGMPAKIEIEGLPGVELEGRVTKVNEYPSPDNWFNSNSKEYGVTVEILNSPTGLRPGMTAKAAIRVENIAQATQVPIQSVLARDGKYYCLVPTGASNVERREVTIGSTNDKFVIVRGGLTDSDQVVVNARAHQAKAQLDDARSLAESRVATRKTEAEPPAAPPGGGGPGT